MKGTLFSAKNVISFLILIIISWAMLYRLDVMPLFLWDESRQANNALEMMQSGNYLFPTYNGEPDFWNTKPHLLIILQAIFYKLLGPGLLALRLPSALAAIAAAFIWLRFFIKRNWIQEGIIYIFILLTCGGFNVYHIARTGDYDALLLLFFTLSITKVYQIIQEKFTRKDIYLFYVYLSLALLTKGLAMAFWIPGFILLFFLYRNRADLKWKDILPGIWIPATTLVLYYGYRGIVTPGYLNAVWNNEVAGRFFAPNEGHVSDWYYYFSELVQHYFTWYWILFILTAIYIFFNRNLFRTAGFFAIFSFLFLLLISSSKTRIHWYMAPVIPCLAATISFGLNAMLNSIKSRYLRSSTMIFVYTSIVIAGYFNWEELWKNNLHREGVHPQVVLQDAADKGKFSYNGTWLLGSYNPMEDYYGKIFRAKKIPFKTTTSFKFHKGDTIIVHRQDYLDSIGKYSRNLQIHAPDHEIPVWVMTVDSVFNANR